MHLRNVIQSYNCTLALRVTANICVFLVLVFIYLFIYSESVPVTSGTCQAGILARFLSFAGHVALRQLIYLEVSVLGEIKRRQGIQESEKEKDRQAKKADRNKDRTALNSAKVSCSCPFPVSGWTCVQPGVNSIKKYKCTLQVGP